MKKGLRRMAGALLVILSLAGSAVSLAVTPAGAKSLETEDYLLGEYRGCLAVFAPGDGLLPSRVTDIQVGLLPQADRERLRQGIPVDSRRALLTLLEDFSS